MLFTVTAEHAVEEWEEWEFVRTTDDEEDRRERHRITLAAIRRIVGRTASVPVVAAVVDDQLFREAVVGVAPLATCPTAQAVRASNDEKRSLGVHVRGDPKIKSRAAFEKRAYGPADARADRERWMKNAAVISGRK